MQKTKEVPFPGMFENPPDGLEADDGQCAECGTPVGVSLTIDPGTGWDLSQWIPTWIGPHGQFLCEDCSIDFL